MQISGNAFIVTGGASGLGGATTRMLAAAGGRVVIADVQADRGEALAAELGSSARFVRCDVSDEADGRSAVDAALALGPLRGLINCAGIAIGEKVVGKEGPHALAAFARVININLIGSFNMIRLAADAMAKQEATTEGERGVLVNTASVAAFDGQIGQAAYAASKGGVVGMTLPIARDLSAVGIRVNTIAPGLIDTPIYGQGEGSEAFKDNLKKGVLFPKRLGAPEELASMVVELIANSYMNAETIRVDGGIRMPPK
jgi:NAD(P)-dependent dehydrogenase (short-subunit alcohol dehydrogenase family)